LLLSGPHKREPAATFVLADLNRWTTEENRGCSAKWLDGLSAL